MSGVDVPELLGGPVTTLVRRAAVDGAEGTFDIAFAGERIIRVGSRLDVSAETEIDAEGRLVLPAFVEPHIHLDKYATLPSLVPDGATTLAESIRLMLDAKRRFTVEDVRRRAGALIRRMVIAGTTAIRTHVDVDLVSGLTGLRGVALARRDHADICDVQIVAFPQLGLERDPESKDLMAQAMREGADVVGGMPHAEDDHTAADRHIAFCMDLAAEHDADVDMHVDETDDGSWHAFDLLVEAAAHRGWGGRTTAGHCCAMAAWDDAHAARAIRRAAEVGVNVVTNPATNLVLQGREDHEPRRRGLTRVNELIAGGVNVAAGHDNLYDGFYPLGAGDQLMIAWLLVHAAQLTAPEERASALASIGASAARVLRIPGYTIGPGGRGDAVIVDAESADEALRLQAPRRWVLRRGRVVAETRRDDRLVTAQAPAA